MAEKRCRPGDVAIIVGIPPGYPGAACNGLIVTVHEWREYAPCGARVMSSDWIIECREGTFPDDGRKWGAINDYSLIPLRGDPDTERTRDKELTEA